MKIVVVFLISLYEVWGMSIPSNNTSTFNPGNTFSNCIQAISCASCALHQPRSGFRTIDGTCNNLRFPTVGARKTPLRRLLHADYVDLYDTPRGFPGTPSITSANEISDELFKVETTNKGTGNLAVLFMTYGQFLDHDLTLAEHPSCSISECGSQNAFKYPCFPILFKQGETRCTSFARAFPVCQNNVRKNFRKPRNQLNELTAFIDGSQIYGSDFRTHQRVRTQDGTGKLKISAKGLMVIDEERTPTCRILGGCSLVGDGRGDENIALHSMHTLWVREHNRIADELKKLNPNWEGELLYQTARKIVGGILQHITYTEWLPHIVRLPHYTGYNNRLNPSIGNGFAAAAFRFGHSLVPNKFSQLNNNFDKAFDDVTLQASFRNRDIINKRGIEPTLFGLVGNRSNNVDNGFAHGLVRKLFIRPGATGHMDLTAMNIQRGRDHGLPTYGRWRRACRLPTVNSFNDLEKYMQKGTVDAFRKVYSNPDDIDLFAAGISEKHVEGLQVGPTFECIFRFQFYRLRAGDRFFYRSNGVFTKNQFNEIRKMTMARVLCNNLNKVVSMQPDAFKVGDQEENKPKTCESIVNLDLSPWKAT